MINVLIIEDDPMVAQLNRQYIEMVDDFFVKDILHTAEDAFALLDDDVDLILLDLFMPGMNGLELLKKIREKGKGVDVLVVSAACDNETIMKVLRLGAIDYIIKPFEFGRLENALRSYKDLMQVMQAQQRMNQEDLDAYLLGKEHADRPAHLPKGIDHNTLKRCWEKIRMRGEIDFSTEELAGEVGVSRVSMRKYLEFLRELGALELKLVYGMVGRPVYQYHCPRNAKQIMARYI